MISTLRRIAPTTFPPKKRGRRFLLALMSHWAESVRLFMMLWYIMIPDQVILRLSVAFIDVGKNLLLESLIGHIPVEFHEIPGQCNITCNGNDLKIWITRHYISRKAL
jgi:hypothetical protein